MFGNRRMPNGMSEEAQSRGHAVWEGAPCKGALYPIYFKPLPKPRSYTQKYESSLTDKNVFNIPLHLT